MKTILTVCLAAAVPASAFAVDLFELEAADRSCEIQQSSIARKKVGTPACDRARQLHALHNEQVRQNYATQRAREYNRSQERIAATPQRVIYTNQVNVPSPQGSGYHWNATYGKYCDHNAQGYATSCY